MKLEPVFIKWRDITVENGWKSQDEIDEFVMDQTENIVHQTGFLYEEDDNQVCLLSSFFENKDFLGDLTKIPRGAILEMVKLKQ